MPRKQLSTRTDTIGARVTIAINSSGHTQVEVARMLEVNLSSVKNYMMGRSTPDAIFCASLCRKFGVQPRWILLNHGPQYEHTSAGWL